jgi:hypothetical protein
LIVIALIHAPCGASNDSGDSTAELRATSLTPTT